MSPRASGLLRSYFTKAVARNKVRVRTNRTNLERGGQERCAFAPFPGYAPQAFEKENSVFGSDLQLFDSECRANEMQRVLAASYRIASGVIEGACRHVVKDRIERTGMSWTTGHVHQA